MMIRVLIGDDHAVVRRGIKQILSELPEVSVIEEASSGDQVLTKTRTDSWDILILDLSLPVVSGLDVLRELKASKPELPVLILSVHAADQYVIRTLKAGASGYLTKESAPEELVQAVQKIVAGGKYLNSSLAENLADYLAGDQTERPHEMLSDREFQIARLLSLGNRISEIASQLSLSPKTVSTYRKRALDKLGLESDAELIQYAIREKLIEIDPPEQS